MLITSIIFFLLFLTHTFFLLNGKYKTIDKNFYHKITIKENTTKILKVITSFASTIFFVILSGFLFLCLDNKNQALAIIIGLIIDSCIIFMVKHIIKRKRPTVNPLVHEKGYSYISGHTFSSTFFYGLLASLIILSSISLTLKVFLSLLIFLFIMTIAYSRIYLGVHYLSDTIGGFILGTSYLLIYLYFTHIILNIF